MKQVLLIVFSVIFITNLSSAQVLTIHNRTNCNIRFYSGTVYVNGAPYNFGSEITPNPIVYANTSNTFTLAGVGMPGFNGSYSQGDIVEFEGFKVTDDPRHESEGYISAAMPYSVCFLPATCNNTIVYYTLVWTGTVANPIVYILP